MSNKETLMKFRPIFLITIFLMVFVCCLFANSPDLQVHFIDVGQADCTLLIDQGQTMLIDAGNNADGRLVVEYLKAMDITHIDYLVGTHPHEDHIGGLDDVMNAFPIGKLIMPAKGHNTASFEHVLDAIHENNLKITVPSVGDEYWIGLSKLTVLAPVRTDYFAINNHSIVFMLERSDKRMLLAADAESISEWHMIGNGADLATDILKVAHHGSDTSTNSTFIKAANPTLSIIHVGKNNPYGHPSASVINRIPGTILRTDIEGTIIVKITNSGEILVDTHRMNPNPAWRETVYIGDSNSKIFHRLDCKSLPSSAYQVGLFNRAEALSLGYIPCSACKP
jgi:competence protein ComEC